MATETLVIFHLAASVQMEEGVVTVRVNAVSAGVRYELQVDCKTLLEACKGIATFR